MVDDPRLAMLRSAFEHRPARLLPRPPDCQEAAVALLLRPRDELELLLIKRAQHEGDPWSGHMAFPGGRRAPEDRDLLATALREATEETGIPLARTGQLIGALDELEPQSRRLPPVLIAPYVLGVPPDTTATPDPHEVETALWVPLPALRAPDAVTEILIELEDGGRRAFPSLRYRDYVIWGLTYRILSQFLEVADTLGL